MWLSDDLIWGTETHDLQQLSVWELSSGTQLACLEIPPGMSHFEFSSDGRYLLGSQAGLAVWETARWTRLDLPFLGRQVAQVGYSSGLLVSAAEFVTLCDLDTKQCLATLDPQPGWVAVGASEFCLCCEVLEEPHYWSTYSLVRYSLPEAHFMGHLDTVRTARRPLSPSYSTCGRHLALPLRDGEVLMWDLDTTRQLPGLHVEAQGFCFVSPGLGLVLEKGRVSPWHLESGQPLGGYLEVPRAQGLRASKRHVFCSTAEGLWVWDLGLLVALLRSSGGRLSLTGPSALGAESLE
ncbi:hypothetical protein IV102_17430 [bacterium]|nr:hypothetical protein [bacterium]